MSFRSTRIDTVLLFIRVSIRCFRRVCPCSERSLVGTSFRDASSKSGTAHLSSHSSGYSGIWFCRAFMRLERPPMLTLHVFEGPIVGFELPYCPWELFPYPEWAVTEGCHP